MCFLSGSGLGGFSFPGLIGKGIKLPSCRKGKDWPAEPAAGGCPPRRGAVPPARHRCRQGPARPVLGLGAYWGHHRPPGQPLPRAPACTLLSPTSRAWQLERARVPAGTEAESPWELPPGKDISIGKLQHSDPRVFHLGSASGRTSTTPALIEILRPILVQRGCRKGSSWEAPKSAVGFVTLVPLGAKGWESQGGMCWEGGSRPAAASAGTDSAGARHNGSSGCAGRPGPGHWEGTGLVPRTS